MKMTVSCPKCSWIGAVDKKLEGKKGKCPKCKESFHLYPPDPNNSDNDVTVEAKIEFKDGKITVTPANS